MNEATIWLHCLLNNWRHRHESDPRWRRIYRTKARQAVYELRYHANRPSKRRNVPTAYGHQQRAE